MRERPNGSGGATEQAGYFGYSVTMSRIMFAVIIISAAATHRFIPYLRTPAPASPGGNNFWSDARGILGNRSAIAMLGVGAFQSSAGG